MKEEDFVYIKDLEVFGYIKEVHPDRIHFKINLKENPRHWEFKKSQLVLIYES